MKFILLSDVHATSKNPIARKDEVLNTFIKKMTFILEYAKREKAVILQAGDFFNRPRDWLLLYLMMKLLDKFSTTKIFTIYGQHDLYLYSDTDTSPTTMSILHKSGYLGRLSKRPIKIKDTFIYGCDYGAEVPIPKGNKNILVIHKSIATKELFIKHDFTSPEYFLRKNKGWNLVLCGDIHQLMFYTSKRSILLNTGPALRLDGNRYNMKHKPAFYIWDSEDFTIKRVEIPHKKANAVLTREHIEKNELNKSLVVFTESIKNSKIDFVSIKDTIRKLVIATKANRIVKNFLSEVMTDEV